MREEEAPTHTGRGKALECSGEDAAPDGITGSREDTKGERHHRGLNFPAPQRLMELGGGAHCSGLAQCFDGLADQRAHGVVAAPAVPVSKVNLEGSFEHGAGHAGHLARGVVARLALGAEQRDQRLNGAHARVFGVAVVQLFHGTEADVLSLWPPAVDIINKRFQFGETELAQVAGHEVEDGIRVHGHQSYAPYREYASPITGLSLRQDAFMDESNTLREVFARNLNALMAARPELETPAKVTKLSGVPNGPVGRYRLAQVSANLDAIQKLAEAFGMPAWQMLVPGLDPHNLPAPTVNPAQSDGRYSPLALDLAMQFDALCVSLSGRDRHALLVRARAALREVAGLAPGKPDKSGLDDEPKPEPAARRKTPPGKAQRAR